jgi:hypothetical protein
VFAASAACARGSLRLVDVRHVAVLLLSVVDGCVMRFFRRGVFARDAHRV